MLFKGMFNAKDQAAWDRIQQDEMRQYLTAVADGEEDADELFDVGVWDGRSETVKAQEIKDGLNWRDTLPASKPQP